MGVEVRLLGKLRLRLRSLLRRGEVERELDEELRFHLEQLIEENLAAGMAPGEARTAALRTLGGVAQVQEACRDTRRMNAIEDLGKDLRHALRVLRRSPGFTAVAVLTLGLGLGATTAIFSVVHGVLLRPLPFAEPDRLVGVWHQRFNHGPGTYFTYRDNQQVFEDLGAWESQQVSVTGAGAPERVEALAVTAATLPLLRVQPALGGCSTPATTAPEHRTGDRHPRILAAPARRRARRDRQVAPDRRPVSPESSACCRRRSGSWARPPTVLLPLQPDRADASVGMFDFQTLARLKPGVTVAQANADVARMIPLLPDSYASYRLRPDVRPLAQDVIGDVGRVLWICWAPWASCCSSPAPTSRTSSSCGPRGASRSWPCAPPWAPAAVASPGVAVREPPARAGGGPGGLVFAQASIHLLRRLAPAACPASRRSAFTRRCCCSRWRSRC